MLDIDHTLAPPPGVGARAHHEPSVAALLTSFRLAMTDYRIEVLHGCFSAPRRHRLGWGASGVIAAVLVALLWASALGASRDVVVGVYENEPKVFSDRNGEPAGIFIDLLREIAAREHWRLRYERCEWSECLSMLQSGTIDLMPDVALTAERRRLYSFHESVALHSWSQVFKLPDAGIESMLDLDGKRIAMLADSVQETALREMIAGFDVGFEILPVGSLDEAFELTRQGTADAAVANHLFGGQRAPAYGLASAPVVFQPSRLFFATAMGRNTDLLEGIDRQLRPLKADPSSVYHQILERWAAPQLEFVTPDWVRQVLIAMLLGGGVLVVGVVVQRFKLRARALESQRLSTRVSESEERYRELAESIYDVIWTLDPETMRFIYVSPSIERLRGYTPEEIIAAPLDVALAPGEVDRIKAVIERSVAEFVAGQRSAQDAVVVEVEQPCKDGTTVWTEVVGNVARSSRSGRLEIRGVTRDITERKQAEAKIQQLAHYDQLTGLPNRALLRDRFAQLLAVAQRHRQSFALLFLDLDHFKDINDTLGHDAGDQLLVEISRRLESVLRAGDTLSRLGGDEYILLLAECNVAGVVSAAQKIMEVVSQPCTIRGHELVTTPSIGIAMYPDDGDDLDTLLRKADAAMYRVKKESRDDFRFYTSEMQAHLERGLLLASALRQALPAGQLSLHYQPQFRLRDRKLVGVEALARWTHPVLGQVSPGEFIPVAESTGLIIDFGKWVLREAARQIRRWQDEGIAPPTLGVNLSAVQFRRADLTDSIRDELALAGIQPEQLEIELTEAVAMDDPEGALRMMRRLAASGVRIAIDDFGTGYSSLSYLKRFTAHKLKIDQSFVRDIGEDEDDRAIVRAIIRLAHSLDMRTIAEGVETQEQLAFLEAEGCDEAQGYLLGRPMSADALREVLVANRALIG